MRAMNAASSDEGESCPYCEGTSGVKVIVLEEVPGLLERLAKVPDPRDPRGVRHALALVLALTACAVLAGATSLLAIGEWIADTPPQLLERLGTRPGSLWGERVSARWRDVVFLGA